MRRSALLWAALAACFCLPAGAAEKRPPELTVLSGGHVRGVLEELIPAFEKHAHVRVRYQAGSSGGVLSACLDRRRADVYVAADLRHVRTIERRDLAAAKLPVAFHRLAILVAKGNPKGIGDLKDLARPHLRVYVEDPNGCQVGEATQRLLARSRIKLAPAAAKRGGPAPTLRTAPELIERGLLDAAVVWDSAAGRLAGRLDTVAIPPARNVKVNIVAVRFRFSPEPALAERLLLFLRGPASRAAWQRGGFQAAPIAPEAPGADAHQERRAERMVQASRGTLAAVYAPLAAQIAGDYRLAGKTGVGIDVGSGPGTLIVELCRRTHLHWINVDINPHFFPHFFRLAEAAGLGHRVSAVRADAVRLPFRDDYADVIVSRGSYQFWSDRKKGLAEIYRVLKPGGVAYVGRGFSRDLPIETARRIRGKQGGGPKYDRRKEADALRTIVTELHIRGFRVELPKPPGGEDVNYGIWLEFRKPAADKG
jgi:ABC-type molybdate transport system substrate-binding protein/SAM-dependent methyltransferase